MPPLHEHLFRYVAFATTSSMRNIAVILIFFFSTSSALASIDTTIKAELYKKDIAIFPASFTDLIPGRPFTPTHEEVDKAEKALATQLLTINKQRINQASSPVIHKNLANYKRQYFGFIDNKGDRILLINCVWSKEKMYLEEWLKSRIMVLDGGSYFWNIKFNLTKSKFFDFEVNGYG
jgi:hypothetical protein